MRGADLAQRGIGEQVVLAFREWAPGLDLYPALAHELLVGGALEERVGLDLIDGGDGFVMVDEIDESVAVEVRNADGLGQAVAVELLHRPPGAVVVAERLVDQIQIDVVQAQPFQ